MAAAYSATAWPKSPCSRQALPRLIASPASLTFSASTRAASPTVDAGTTTGATSTSEDAPTGETVGGVNTGAVPGVGGASPSGGRKSAWSGSERSCRATSWLTVSAISIANASLVRTTLSPAADCALAVGCPYIKLPSSSFSSLTWRAASSAENRRSRRAISPSASEGS